MPSFRRIFRSQSPPSQNQPHRSLFRRRTHESIHNALPPSYEQAVPVPPFNDDAKQNPFADSNIFISEKLHHLYSEKAILTSNALSYKDVPEGDPYESLAFFDTVFLIDDSGSMCGTNWEQTKKALSVIVPICTKYDTDGVDVYFLNRNTTHNKKIRSATDVLNLFNSVAPSGATPTGRRLGTLLQDYMNAYRRNSSIKPLNVICITDGEPTDPATLERVIVDTAQELDRLKAKDRQLGVQFFQVGSDRSATEALEDLDNSLVEEYRVRDMVDTISWKKMNGEGLTADGILKAVMGAVDARLDRQRRLR